MQSAPRFDPQQMINDMDGDVGRFSTVARMVTNEFPHHLAAMRESFEAGRLEGLEFAARSVAMLCDSLLAEAAADASRDLESAARRRCFDEVAFAFETLEDEIEAVLEDLCRAIATTA